MSDVDLYPPAPKSPSSLIHSALSCDRSRLDGNRPALLCRDERLYPARCSRPALVRDGGRPLWLRKIEPGESGEAVVLHFSLVALAVLLIVSLPVWRWPDWWSGLLLIGAGIGGGAAQLAMTRAYSIHR